MTMTEPRHCMSKVRIADRGGNKRRELLDTKLQTNFGGLKSSVISSDI